MRIARILSSCCILVLTVTSSITSVHAQNTSSSAPTSSPQPGVNKNYANLLTYSMWFYEALRSGKLPSNNRVSWRHDSGLQDGQDHNVDLTGGYYDAGDYLKFTLPLAHSLALISWGGIEWYDGYTKANQASYLHDTVRWGTDWLMKAHPDSNTLYVQVGSGDIDNNYWGPDTGIPTPRPSYFINNTATGTDVAAMTAAALASASYLFANLANDTNYANQLSSAAQSVFALAETQPFHVYTDSVPAADGLYQTNTYMPQLVYGALWMYKATGNSTYRDKASNYFDQFSLGASTVSPMDWSDPTGAVYVLGAELDNSNTKYATAAKRWLDTMTNPSAPKAPCVFTNGGMLWCDGYSNSNSMVPLQDTSLLALLYSRLDSSKSQQYTDFATKQIDYMLGNNYMLTPYVCGVHANSPHNPHHAGASGGTDINNINTSPAEELHILYGAIVGGPNKDDIFYDERNDWSQTEVALDYNAPFQGLMAYQISTNASDPPYVSITDPRPYVSRSHGLAGWLIAVIVIVILFILAGIGYFAWLKREALRRRFGKNKEYAYAA
ncbi:Six-hairpin glycosidase-like protein [Halteromyces radiatus]|uniref:Six-hairpin glycosidase-like protein n=1 Tax=Halteromyces radiatus TaxID=101107 RepID=UPI00221F5ADF|nr:Six-hairpin glycosidase-like protein [Halteromyces radiatus]KAI8089409.1 Six-hairpin glycosidase-like protein [Halteromyces radiatus]